MIKVVPYEGTPKGVVAVIRFDHIPGVACVIGAPKDNRRGVVKLRSRYTRSIRAVIVVRAITDVDGLKPTFKAQGAEWAHTKACSRSSDATWGSRSGAAHG